MPLRPSDQFGLDEPAALVPVTTAAPVALALIGAEPSPTEGPKVASGCSLPQLREAQSISRLREAQSISPFHAAAALSLGGAGASSAGPAIPQANRSAASARLLRRGLRGPPRVAT